MYGACGHPTQARATFDAISHKNSHSWNIMLAAYLHSGDLANAQKLLHEMPFDDSLACNALLSGLLKSTTFETARKYFETMKVRDVVSWNIIVAANAKRGDMSAALDTFVRMPCTNTASWNSIVSGYIKSGQIDAAYRIFTSMVDRDVFSWTSMMVAVSQLGRSVEAFRLFRLMDLDGVPPDAFTFSSVIDACGDLSFATAGKLVQEELQLSGLRGETNVENSLVTMHTKLDHPDKAWKIFHSMPCRDVVSWTAISTAFARPEHLDLLKSVFERLPQHDIVSWTSFIFAFSSAGMIQVAEDLFSRAPLRNLVTWNTMLTAYASSGRYDLVLRFFKSMDLEGTRPDRVSFVLAIESCAGLASLPQGRLLHSLCIESFELPLEIATSLIHLYGRCGCLDTARDIFDSVAGKDRVPWNVMLSTYAESGNYSVVIELFRVMATEGVVVDEITSVAVITACSRAGGVEDGRQCFACLVGEFGVRPVIDHYICVMDAMGRVGMMDEAQEVLEAMPFERDEAAWMVFLSACNLHKDVERAASVACRAVRTGSATPATFVLLSNSFASDDKYI